MPAWAEHMRFPVRCLLAVCCAAAALAGCGSGSSGPDVLTGDIRVPTLVADGTRDQFIGTANARQLASSVPGAKLLLFEDAGHAFLFQDATTFAQAVEAFMG